MSHINAYENKVLENVTKEEIVQGLKDMNLDIDWNKHKLHTGSLYSSEESKNHFDGIILDKNGRETHFGVKLTDNGNGKYKAVIAGEAYGSNLNERDLANGLSQACKTNEVIRKMKKAYPTWTHKKVYDEKTKKVKLTFTGYSK